MRRLFSPLFVIVLVAAGCGDDGAFTPTEDATSADSTAPAGLLSPAVMRLVTAGGPGLVAVGADDFEFPTSAVVWVSEDGFSWSRVSDVEGVFEDAEIKSVTVGGSGLVAVGTDDFDFPTTSVVWVSEDGRSWSRVPDVNGVLRGAEMRSVTAGGPGLVAVGVDFGSEPSRAAVWTSPDGVEWSRVPLDEEAFHGTAMYSVTAGGPGLVAVGDDGMPRGGVWISADGSSWTRATLDAEFPPSDLFFVNTGGPGLVAVGLRSDLWMSPDGLSWSRVPADEAVFGNTEVQSVVAGGPGLVAVGRGKPPRQGETDDLESDGLGAAVLTSPDGVTWSRVPHDEAVFGGTRMISVTAGGPGLVAVGFGAVVWTSPDGFSWSRVYAEPFTEPVRPPGPTAGVEEVISSQGWLVLDLGPGQFCFPGDFCGDPLGAWAAPGISEEVVALISSELKVAGFNLGPGFPPLENGTTSLDIFSDVQGLVFVRVYDQTAEAAYLDTDLLEEDAVAVVVYSSEDVG